LPNGCWKWSDPQGGGFKRGDDNPQRGLASDLTLLISRSLVTVLRSLEIWFVGMRKLIVLPE